MPPFNLILLSYHVDYHEHNSVRNMNDSASVPSQDLSLLWFIGGTTEEPLSSSVVPVGTDGQNPSILHHLPLILGCLELGTGTC